MENLFEADKLQELIELNAEKATNYEKLLNYYKGKHATIEEKSKADPNLPNNKIVNNYASYITDLQVGYFIAKPIAYRIQDNDMNEMIDDILTDSDEHDMNTEIAKDCSIYGEGFEIVYLDEEGALRLARLNPSNVIPIYDNTIQRRLKGAIRYYEDEEEVLHAEVYTNNTIEYWEDGEDGFANTETVEHYFGEVPIIHYINNEEIMGDFEQVLSLIDDYNARISDSADDIEYFADAYLKIKNMSATTNEDLKEMRENKAILVEENGDVDFITKGNGGNPGPGSTDGHISVVNNNIHKFSKTPDFSDEKFAGNVSGVAIKYKLLSMEQVTGIKERKFTKGLNKRFRIIIDHLNKKFSNEYEHRDIKPVFTRNIPDNIKELSEVVKSLAGIVPTETLLALLPFIEDPNMELKLLKSEEQSGETLEYSVYKSLNPNTENISLGTSTLSTKAIEASKGE